MAQVVTTILLDDSPKGLRLLEIANWAGKAFVVPRSKLKELRSRDDAKQPGMYILFGDGEGQPAAYIGQSENVTDRLLSHDLKRRNEEWNTAIIFVGQLDSTFIKYLESISLDLAKKANRYNIFNSASPRENSLSEAQKIVANEYFERIKLITSLLGYSLFEVVSESVLDSELYYLQTEGSDAKAQLLEDGSLNVLQGSLARIRETGSFGGWAKSARQRFIEEGTLIETENGISYEFTKDTVFSSPSAAAATISGRSINGWTSWKDDKGNTLDDNLRN